MKFLIFFYLIFLFFTKAYSQPFELAPTLNPFGLLAASSHNRFAFGDLDNDGDLDIIALEEFGTSAPFLFFQNIGTINEPLFSNPFKNPFGLPPLNWVNMIYLHDFDGDKDLDLFAGGETSFFYFENKGTLNEPNFSNVITNPFGLIAPAGSNTLIPTFGDLDGDSDLDLIVGDFNGRLYYYKNSGTLTNQIFEAPVINPFGYIKPDSDAIFLAPVLEDANKDGLLDLWVGYNPGFIRLYINKGTSIMPSLGIAEFNPLGLGFSSFPIWAMPIFADIDGDGDRDMFVTSFPNVYFYENISQMVTSNKQQWKAEAISSVSAFPNPTDEGATVAFTLDRGVDVQIRLTDIRGEWISTIVSDSFFAGKHLIRLETIGLPSGMYIIQILADGVPHRIPLIVKN